MQISEFTLNTLANCGDDKAAKARFEYKTLSKWTSDNVALYCWYNDFDDSFSVALAWKSSEKDTSNKKEQHKNCKCLECMTTLFE